MRVCVIRPNAEYTVCVVPDEGPCKDSPVIIETNELFSEHVRLHAEVWKSLYHDIPIDGLPKSNGTRLLRNNIHEFRFGRLPGIGFRVLWFEGEEAKEFVCSNAFRKVPRQSTPDAAIDLARFHRKRFLAALKKGRIERTEMRPSEL